MLTTPTTCERSEDLSIVTGRCASLLGKPGVSGWLPRENASPGFEYVNSGFVRVVVRAMKYRTALEWRLLYGYLFERFYRHRRAVSDIDAAQRLMRGRGAVFPTWAD